MKSFLIVCFILISISAGADTGNVVPGQFLLGASTYPELQTRAEWNRTLDHFQKAHFKVVRVSESSWGNLETAPGEYKFGWLKDYLDDVQRHGMKAILGTGTYIAPQWLTAKHPETLVQLRSGEKVHPMGRKAACINSELFRERIRHYLLAFGAAFKNHPAVIGWQLDNEIEPIVDQICYCDSCERAWHRWLKDIYGGPQEFNRRLKLVSWGMEVDSLDDVPQPRAVIESQAVPLPALTLASLHFRRDAILGFLEEQKKALREAGVTQWLTTDWNTVWNALADDPRAKNLLDVASLNFYQPSARNPDFWRTLSWHLDMHRSAHGLGSFLATETRVGVMGDTLQTDPSPNRDQFRMWMLQPAAYGAFGLMYWSGNRWHGGHWPHWGGVLDWTDEPEPDFAWVVEIGAFFERYGNELLTHPVKATAAVITDFDQRATLSAYPHVPSSREILPQTFDALHRLGVGADALSFESASQPGALGRYSLVIIPAAPALESPMVTAALRSFVEGGGNLVVTPLTAYQSWDGLFRHDGFGANLAEVTGVIVRTARRMWASNVSWMGTSSLVGIDGLVEYLDIGPEAEVIGHFKSDDPILDGRPAATRRYLGKGATIKLAFWPQDDSLLLLFRQMVPSDSDLLAVPAPVGVQAVPRTDGSLFVINTRPGISELRLSHPVSDRLSGRMFSGTVSMMPCEVFWLESGPDMFWFEQELR